MAEITMPRLSGSMVPVGADADAKTLAQIAAETRALAQLARTGSLTPDQVSGATFTISNLGMYGITQFTADAATFVQSIKTTLEQPLRLLV